MPNKSRFTGSFRSVKSMPKNILFSICSSWIFEKLNIWKTYHTIKIWRLNLVFLFSPQERHLYDLESSRDCHTPRITTFRKNNLTLTNFMYSIYRLFGLAYNTKMALRRILLSTFANLIGTDHRWKGHFNKRKAFFLTHTCEIYCFSKTAQNTIFLHNQWHIIRVRRFVSIESEAATGGVLRNFANFTWKHLSLF